MPICLIILNRDTNSTDIYELSNLFYMRVRVESYRKTGSSQYFSCQKFGYGSQLCEHPPRCVKCSDNHLVKEYPKTYDKPLTCYYCEENHTENYRKCPYYIHVLETTKPKQSQIDVTKDKKPLRAPSIFTTSTTPQKTFGNQLLPNSTIDISSILKLLQGLLTTLTTTFNPQKAMIQIITAFVSILFKNVIQ